MAIPSDKMLQVLTNLTQNPLNTVFIISGRDKEFLDLHFAQIHNLGLCAEHGCFIKLPKSFEWIENVRKDNLNWWPVASSIFEHYTNRTPGSFVEVKQASLSWHYRQSNPFLG